ncbi:MAG TPA: hypothetical protein VH371_11090 [Candidatus Limnocylindrales bacterium]
MYVQQRLATAGGANAQRVVDNDADSRSRRDSHAAFQPEPADNADRRGIAIAFDATNVIANE